MHISDYRTGIFWHKLDTLADDLGYTARHIKRGTHILEQLGIINKKQRGFNKSNLYCLNFTLPQNPHYHYTSSQNVPLSYLSKREDSINTNSNTLSEKPTESVPKLIVKDGMFELTYDWSPDLYTINNLERILGFNYEKRDSERRSWIAYTLKQAGGKKVYLTQKQANAMYFHFCKTSKEKEKHYILQGKPFISMEQRRNYHEQKQYPEPKPIQRYEREIDNHSIDLGLFKVKRSVICNNTNNWEVEAARKLAEEKWMEGLSVEQRAIFSEYSGNSG
jgi:hypothetical protein